MKSALMRAPAPRGRLICIGDIHGCYDELVALLDELRPVDGDVVVSVGDIVRKGPSVAECLRLWRERGYLAVRGNNEEKLLRYARWGPFGAVLDPADRSVLLHRDLVRFIDTFPVAIDFPDLAVSVIHGGVLPGMRLSEESVRDAREEVVRLRWLREQADGGWQYVPKGKQAATDRLWSEIWSGPQFVLYGHTPVRTPKRDPFALGLDTGCVYGGELTAAVLGGGSWRIVSVRAKRAYATR